MDRIPNNYNTINVEAAIADNNSILYVYKKLIELRHKHDIITYGSIEPLYMDDEHLFIYKRHYKGETWLVISNFSKSSITLPKDLNIEGDVILQNGECNNGTIDGFGAIVIAQ
jgi:trehalose-6-phosphate hydrolase